MSDTKQKEQVYLKINKYAENANTNHAIQTRSAQTDIQKVNNYSATQDSQKTVVLNWLGCLFFGFIPPFLILLLKRNDTYARSQAKEALNWCITFLIATIGLSIIATMLAFILTLIYAPLAAIPALLVTVFGLSHFLVCFVGAYKGFSGKDFRVPLNIRIIK